MSDHIPPPYIPIGVRRHGRHIDLPLDARLRARLGRAIVRALVDPVRCTPTLRRTTRAVAAELRGAGFTEEGIQARLAMLIQAVALADGHDSKSIVSGKPRWQELGDRVGEWITLDAPRDEEQG